LPVDAATNTMKETNPSFTVKPFKNRNGVISWRVSGWMHGLRIRRNFKDRQAAFVERGALDLKLMQTQAGLRPVATSLTEAQVREAEALFHRFDGKPRPLAFYADSGLAHFKEPRVKILLSEAAKTYLEARRIEEKKHLICARQMAAIEGEMDTLLAHFPLKRLHELSRTALETYLNRGSAALKTFNNRRALVHTFFEFACHREDWLKVEDNPMEKIPRHRIEHSRGAATALTAVQAAQLMAHVETVEDGVFVPYFALCLFAGIRPNGEITKLPASDVRVENSAITIEPWVSKVNMRRLITIQPNLTAWLKACPLDEYPVIPPRDKMKSIAKKLTRIRQKFGVGHDVLRHTFISMHVAKFRSMGDTALQAGNSESIIRRHYLNVTTPQEAETFFGIAPKKAPAVKTTATAEEAGASQPAGITADDASEPRSLAA
jgi:integrase